LFSVGYLGGESVDDGLLLGDRLFHLRSLLVKLGPLAAVVQVRQVEFRQPEVGAKRLGHRAEESSPRVVVDVGGRRTVDELGHERADEKEPAGEEILASPLLSEVLAEHCCSFPTGSFEISDLLEHSYEAL
jgi:hypothetical protein